MVWVISVEKDTSLLQRQQWEDMTTVGDKTKTIANYKPKCLIERKGTASKLVVSVACLTHTHNCTVMKLQNFMNTRLYSGTLCRAIDSLACEVRCSGKVSEQQTMVKRHVHANEQRTNHETSWVKIVFLLVLEVMVKHLFSTFIKSKVEIKHLTNNNKFY